MPQVLKLQYACTHAEGEEAEELNVGHRLARGQKWRNVLIVVGTIVLLYLKMVRDFSPAVRPYVIGTEVIFIIVILVWWRLWRQKPSRPTKLEIT